MTELRYEWVERAAEAIADHTYDVSVPDWAVTCTGCDWLEQGGVPESHDRHVASLALAAVVDLIRADTLREAADEILRRQDRGGSR